MLLSSALQHFTASSDNAGVVYIAYIVITLNLSVNEGPNDHDSCLEDFATYK